MLREVTYRFHTLELDLDAVRCSERVFRHSQEEREERFFNSCRSETERFFQV